MRSPENTLQGSRGLGLKEEPVDDVDRCLTESGAQGCGKQAVRFVEVSCTLETG